VVVGAVAQEAPDRHRKEHREEGARADAAQANPKIAGSDLWFHAGGIVAARRLD
jgi:hypothetical protein